MSFTEWGCNGFLNVLPLHLQIPALLLELAGGALDLPFPAICQRFRSPAFLKDGLESPFSVLGGGRWLERPEARISLPAVSQNTTADWKVRSPLPLADARVTEELINSGESAKKNR